jgi:hypothetical protein
MFFSMLCLYLLGTAAVVFADAGELIEVDLIVNVEDTTDPKQVDEAIKKANEILAQAGIRLNKVKTNTVNFDSSGTGIYSRSDRDKAREEGAKECDKTAGAGKGLKMNLTDDPMLEDTGVLGVAVHNSPVVIVKPGDDPNEYGHTIAHEFAHSLTLNYDFYDPNDPNLIRRLMWGYDDGGTELTEEEKEEIRKTARKRGWTEWLWLRPQTTPGGGGGPRGSGSAALCSVAAYGALLDTRLDLVQISGDPVPISLEEPDWGVLDLDEVSVYCENPGEPGAVMDVQIKTNGTLDGLYHIDSFFDVTYRIEFDDTGDFAPDYQLDIHIVNPGPDFAPIVEDALLENLGDGSTMPIPTEWLTNFELGSPDPPELGGQNTTPHDDQFNVPIPSDFFGPGSDPFDGIIAVQVSSAYNNPIPGWMVVDEPDAWFPFEIEQTKNCPSIRLMPVNWPEPIPGETEFGPIPHDLANPASMGISGCGWEPNQMLEVMVDDSFAATTMADSEGCFKFFLPAQDVPLGPTPYASVVVREPRVNDPADPLTTAPKTATVYLNRRMPLTGDVNFDGAVNLLDVSEVGQQWLMEYEGYGYF